MRCSDIDMFFDQLCEKEPEEWFVLHMMGCKECREEFEFIGVIREVLREMHESEEPREETLDDSARHWMTWMTGEKPSGRSSLQ